MKKEPFISLEKAKEIKEKFPTPFHIYDEAGIKNNAIDVNKAFSWNKGYKEYFAIKANPNPFLIQILKDQGCGVDCSSVTELMIAEALGFRGDDIMFSSNDTKREEYNYVAKLDGIINLDDYGQIDILKETLDEIPKTMSLRFNPGGTYGVSNEIMDNPGDAKYGMTKEQLIDGYKELVDMGVESLGLHAFLVSNTLTNEYYATLASTLFDVAIELKEKHGITLDFINLSGGVGVDYKPEDEANDIFAISENVKKVFEEKLVPAGLGNTRICTEMGRFMTGPYGALVTTAINEKHIHKEYIGVDACAVDLMRPAMYGAYHHISVLGKVDAMCNYTYDVTGSLCENNDKFAIDRKLPKIEMGDLLYIHDTGGHGYSMGYNYNGKLKSAEVLLHEDGSFDLIRRAEEPRDYFATFDQFDIYKKLVK